MVETLSTERVETVETEVILYVLATVEVNEVMEVMQLEVNTDYLLLQISEQTIRYVVEDDVDEQVENDETLQ